MPTPDLDLIDAVYCDAACMQILRLAEQATWWVRDCGNPLKALAERPELPAQHRDACQQMLQTIADRHATLQTLISKFESLGRMDWSSNEYHGRMRRLATAHAVQQVKQVIEGINTAELRFIADCEQGIEAARQLDRLGLIDWNNGLRQVVIGVELEPVPGRDLYQNCLSGKPLLVGTEHYTVSDMVFDEEGHNLFADPDHPFYGDHHGYLVHLLIEHSPLPLVLFPSIKAIYADVQYLDCPTLWQRAATPGKSDDGRLTPLVTQAFDSWYLTAARDATVGCIRKAQHQLRYVQKLVEPLADRPELAQRFRTHYEKLAKTLADMDAQASSLLTAMKTFVPCDVQRRIDALATAEPIDAEVLSMIGQARQSLDAAERRFVELGCEALEVVAKSVVRGIPRRPKYVQFDFAVELETAGHSSVPAQPDIDDEEPLCFDATSYSVVSSSQPTKARQSAPEKAVTAAGALPAASGAAHTGDNSALLTSDLTQYSHLPPTFFPLIKSVDVTLTLALRTVLWQPVPMRSEPDGARERRDEA